jgi:D-sedoheptulose 7-phosphate isomerase
VNIHEYTRTYLEKVKACLDEISPEQIEKAASVLWQAYEEDQQIFIVGNGGSASTASHFACDLSKGTAVKGRRRWRAMSLTDNVAILSAQANDHGYETIFAAQLENYLKPNDVIVIITGSGDSPNILRAVEFAKGREAISIGLTGFGGGAVSKLLDHEIRLSSTDYGHVESVHLVLTQLLTAYFLEQTKGSPV